LVISFLEKKEKKNSIQEKAKKERKKGEEVL